MKFTIGTASSSMNFEEDLKLIKSSLLYADSIELIGMAEYRAWNPYQRKRRQNTFCCHGLSECDKAIFRPGLGRPG